MRVIKHRRGNSLRTRNRKVNEIINYFSCTDRDTLNATNKIVEGGENEKTQGILKDSVDGEGFIDFSESDEYNTNAAFLANSDDLFPSYERIEISRTLEEDIRDWSLTTNVPNSSVDLILKILHKHGHKELPTTARTLKNTPGKISIRTMEPGLFWYFGIKSILKVLEYEQIMFPKKLTLDVNMDGVTLFGSSHACYWPLLGRFSELSDLKPFIIGLYFDEGGAKPKDINDYLSEFTNELYDLISQGYKGISLNFGNCPLDAPALAFVKDTKSHNSKKACHKCGISGKRIAARMCYTKVENLILRTDESFRSHDDPLHHQSASSSPLEKLPINMISNFNLDYLHVVLLGVTRKKLRILLNKSTYRPHSSLRAKLRKTNFDEIVFITNMTRRAQPQEIRRSIRTLKFLGVMKGKEYRTFILYYGIVALLNNVDKEIYENYLTLHIALTICLSNEHRNLLHIAEACFKKFVKEFKHIYGHCNASYNIHSLLHLVDEVRMFGPLDNYSTFPFENMIGFLKKLPHSGHLPLQQGVKRYMESLSFNIQNYKKKINSEGEFLLTYIFQYK